MDAIDNVENVRQKNVELLIEIANLCNRRDKTQVENIFLLGKSGAGKSSLVNTVIKVFAGKYIPKARVGTGNTQSKTLTLDRYESCGVTREDLEDGKQRDIVQGILPRLPTILDAAGKGDINTEALQEILELLIGGFIPPGTSIEALEDLQKDNYVGALKEIIYKKCRPEWKVTKVVFVQSCRDTVPKNLIECLQNILKMTDNTAQQKYTADVYVVITMYDLVKDQLKYSSPDDKKTITMEEFEKMESMIAKAFFIEGALMFNRIRWVSYTDTTNFDNPFIDNIALKFIRRMVMPGSPQSEPIQSVITNKTRLELKANKWWREQNFTCTHLFIVVMGVLVALFLFIMFTAPLK